MNRKYTQEHINFIAANIQGTKFKDLTAMFNEQFGMNLSVPAMVSMTAMRGLHNGISVVPEFIENGKATRFQKGQIPPNKGVKGTHLSPATEFKKGNIPANHRPVGSERVSVDGYTEVKVADPNKWRMKHVIAWETVNGPVPKGHVVIFADGNRGNIEIENLLLVTRGQLAVMNRMKGGNKNKMPNHKYSNEQLLELLKDPKYKSNRQIAIALGKKSIDGALNERLNQLREDNGIPKPSGKRGAPVLPKAARNIAAPKIQEIDSTYKVPAPPPGTELLKFDDIRPGDPLLRNGKPIDVIGLEKDKKSAEKDRLIIKDRFNYTDKVMRKYFDDNPGKFVRDEARIGSKAKPVNEAHKLTAGNIKVNGQPIQNLPDSVKEKIVEKLKEDAVPDPAENTDLEIAIESAPTDAGPLHIGHFEDVDYTDSEWDGAEKEISDTVLARREYLDKIDQLLDLMISDCTDKDMAFKVAGVAAKILENGIADEIAALMEVAQ